MKIKKIDEYKVYNQISDEELMEMSNLSSKATGIEDVIIWVGPNPLYHGKRIKVSNIPNKISKIDCFTITIPDLEIIGYVNSAFIDKKKLEKIKEFVKINMEVLSKYSDGEIFTDEMIALLKKV
jgi:ribosome biogenesis protein Tsr3